MSRSEVEIIETGRRWQAAGEQVVLATVARTWGSSPRQVGAVMALAASGRIAGSVSGGCIEAELIERVRTEFPARFTTLEYSSDAHRALPCGGRLLLALEPLAGILDLDGMLGAIASGSAVARTLDLTTGTVRWEHAGDGARGALDGDVLRVVYEPAWRLIVAGGGELAQWVCRFAQLLDYAVSACDPRPEYGSGWPLTEVPLAAVYPDDFIDPESCDARTAVVALTHDPKIDDLAMLQALRSSAFYIGALGSRRTTASRAARLREHFHLEDATVARIRGPIGIDLNTRRPAEIALAVLADITAARNGVSVTTARAHA